MHETGEGPAAGTPGKLEKRSFLFMLAVITALFLYLLAPFFGPIFWACVIGLIFQPLHVRLTVLLGNRTNLSALVTLFVCFLTGIIPALFIVGSFFQEGAAIYDRLQSGEIDPGAYVQRIKEAFPLLHQFLDRFGLDVADIQSKLSDAAINLSRLVAENALSLGQGTLQGILNLGLLLYVAFFMLRDGPWLVTLLVRALPLGDEQERHLFAKFAEVTRATVKGNLVVAAIQGGLGGLIFWILGIPGPILWGVVMTFMSLIPMLGAGLIWIPVAIYLFAAGAWVDGLILVAFGTAVIGLVDNILRPILVGRDTKLPDYVVLISTLGGLVLFGINGFVIGPLLAALFVAFWQIFMRDFNPPEDDGAEAVERGDKCP